MEIAEIISLTEAGREELIKKIGEGSRDSFTDLYRSTAKAVYSYALSIMRNTPDAEDAMQETFLSIRSAAHLYKPSGKPMAWIFRITRNICLMKLRKEKKITPLEDIREIPDLSMLENSDDRMTLDILFSKLKEDECQIIILHSVSGLKHREISELLDMPLPTVLSKYNRGLKKLRKELEENHERDY